MSIITESEKKRLRSLKEKKQSFKAKEQLIKQALSNLDNTKNNKKIIFDDIDEEQSLKSKRKIKKDLFDNDDDNNEQDSLWNEEEFKVKKDKKTTLGNDVRFTLDKRFTEDNCQTEESKIEDTNEYNLQKEKEKQLDILENILGIPLSVKNQEPEATKKGLMIRYDPTKDGHGEYEVKPTQSAQLKTKETNTKKKKHDKIPLEIENPALPEVSKDIYFTVSNVLTESLKQKEEFSLLKTHGKENQSSKNTKDDDTFAVENKDIQKFKFGFNANNVFKDNLSDDENAQEIQNEKHQIISEVEEDIQQNNLFGCKDTLFFDHNDMRFNEAIKFFSAKAASSGELNNLRRELKTIVRMKIRNNIRRHQPYGTKRKIKRF
ncbi:hypothetical protein PUN28_015209 [Cardiocondyla obscurior]|uniref:Nucleolar protein 8 n=1 Tax=Cardiocondyla obscurior TaxID=286306 RepID=A0AAW2F192_9HYME